MPLTIQKVRSVLKRRFGGKILSGSHEQNGKCCILELASVIREIPWTDSPVDVRCFDIRPINDVYVSEALRSEWMPKLLVAYDGSLDWPESRQRHVVERLVILTVQRIVAELPSLSDDIRNVCRKAETISDATVAAKMAYEDTACSVAYAAVMAARAASLATAYAANAASRVAAGAASRAAYRVEEVFVDICELWLDAAKL